MQKREVALLVASESHSKSEKCLKSYREFLRRVKAFRLNGWLGQDNSNFVELSLSNSDYVLAKYQIFSDKDLCIKVRVFGWILVCDHQLLSRFYSSFLCKTGILYERIRKTCYMQWH